jgi:hypothetical protein
LLLKHLIKELPVIGVDGPLDREVAGIVYDSRRVTPGMVFVAISRRARGRPRFHQHGDRSRSVARSFVNGRLQFTTRDQDQSSRCS